MGYEIGINFTQSERAADLVLISTFTGIEDLEKYIINPDHQAAAGFILKVRESSWVVDYEIN